MAVGQVFFPVLLSSLSVTFHQCSIHISIYMLPEGEEDEACNRPKSCVLSAVEDCEIERCFYLVLRSSPSLQPFNKYRFKLKKNCPFNNLSRDAPFPVSAAYDERVGIYFMYVIICDLPNMKLSPSFYYFLF